MESRICDVSHYYVSGTSSTGDELDIEFPLEQLAKAMEQKEAYDEYMAGLTGDYEELGSLWKRVSEQVDLMYAEISERELSVTGEGLEASDLYNQYFNAFSKEYDRLWEANQ